MNLNEASKLIKKEQSNNAEQKQTNDKKAIPNFSEKQKGVMINYISNY